MRLIGVEYDDFVILAQGDRKEGVRTFVIDVDLSSFLWTAQKSIWRLKRKAKARELALLEKELDNTSAWYQVDFFAVAKGLSYFYSTFSAAPPTFLDAIRIASAKAPEPAIQPALSHMLAGFLDATKTLTSPTDVAPKHDTLKFTAFHVGQGMCTMVESSQHGIMLDAGAGKPITRERYLAGLKTNDLQSAVNSMKSIPYFVLSHFDNDHWNLLAWDKSLRDKVERILVPKVSKRSARSVAFFDKEVIHKVEQTVVATIILSKNASIEIRRTQPKASDSNGHALISVVEIGERRALVPGDYVYSRMKTDTDSSIALWAAGPYAAVVVPHHGDAESAKYVPPCAKDGKAFFSAGTHDTWDHPKQVSIDKHKAKDYQAIHDRNEVNIISKALILG